MSTTRILSHSCEEVRVFVPGKVNLFLRVGPVLPGGKRHSLLTVFQGLSRGEVLRLRQIGTKGTELPDEVCTTWEPGLPPVSGLDGSGNLVYAALQRLRERVGLAPTRVQVRKALPVAGGMAGGSADAAGALVGANALYRLGLDTQSLREIAAQLGADVPFGITGGLAQGNGCGDLISPLPPAKPQFWVFALSHQGLSTPQVFAEFDRLHPRIPELADSPPAEFWEGLRDSPQRLGAALHNDLEEAALSLRPELGEVISAATQEGAWRAIVSGSGPTVACLCESHDTALQVQARLSACPQVSQAIVATTLSSAPSS